MNIIRLYYILAYTQVGMHDYVLFSADEEKKGKSHNLFFLTADMTIIMKKASEPSVYTRLKIHTLYCSAEFQPSENWQQCK